MSKSKKLGVIKSIAILVIICLVTSGALAVVNSYTAPVIQAASEERENQARQSVMPDATDFEQLDVKDLPDGVVSVYQGKDSSGKTAGYVFTVEGKGFGGTISVMCAIDNDGTILNCSTLDVSGETATLGGKTANPEYTDQYQGKDKSLDGVNAISGATITSTAYRGCVEKAFAAYELVKEAA
ncbi:MAG: FMN-binding protein [Eubacteriales bacterium]|nr:FMN-binding protein [Eubacteriales bacterium]